MPDNFAAYAAGLDSPAADAAAVTPNDGADLPTGARGLYVGTSGTVKVDMVGGTTGITFTGVTGGSILPIRAQRVYATGTTASNIVALY